MIPQNELRVGNKVLNAIGIIIDVDYTVIGTSSFYDPIPLTSEILELCGLTPEYGYGIIYPLPKKCVSIEFIEKDNSFWIVAQEPQYDHKFGGINNISYHNKRDKPIQYLHQLQNLYYSITGEELNNISTVQECDATEVK